MSKEELATRSARPSAATAKGTQQIELGVSVAQSVTTEPCSCSWARTIVATQTAAEGL